MLLQGGRHRFIDLAILCDLPPVVAVVCESTCLPKFDQTQKVGLYVRYEPISRDGRDANIAIGRNLQLKIASRKLFVWHVSSRSFSEHQSEGVRD